MTLLYSKVGKLITNKYLFKNTHYDKNVYIPN